MTQISQGLAVSRTLPSPPHRRRLRSCSARPKRRCCPLRLRCYLRRRTLSSQWGFAWFSMLHLGHGHFPRIWTFPTDMDIPNRSKRGAGAEQIKHGAGCLRRSRQPCADWRPVSRRSLGARTYRRRCWPGRPRPDTIGETVRAGDRQPEISLRTRARSAYLEHDSSIVDLGPLINACRSGHTSRKPDMHRAKKAQPQSQRTRWVRRGRVKPSLH